VQHWVVHHDPVESVGPLAGVRVLELGNFIAGPFAGQLLGDYGADVIKVEAPDGGDPMRAWGITHDGDGLWWPAIARNKRSVVADLRTDAGRELVQSIARTCDVIVENFRVGRLVEFGLDYETVARTNPGVIVVHVSGFGQTGPRAQEAGFGSIGEAVGGIRHTTGEPDRPSARCGVSLGDSLAALFAVVGTLAALHERDQSGKGQEVDVAIYEAVAAVMESTMADFEIGHVVRGRSGGSLPGVAPSGAYPAADGSDVLIAANADSVFARLCAAMARADLASDQRFATHAARGTNATELDDLISQWTHRFDSEALLRLLAEHAVPAGRVYTAPDMLNDPHYLAREMVLRATSRAGLETPMTGIVPRFSRTPGRVRDVGPNLGEHTDEVVGEIN
jgi:formyl-CoA transferase